MIKTKVSHFTKSDISKDIKLNLGISTSYSNNISEDMIIILKDFIKKKELTISNFGVFKIKHKKKRIGRNPKSGKSYEISARRTLSFLVSKKNK